MEKYLLFTILPMEPSPEARNAIVMDVMFVMIIESRCFKFKTGSGQIIDITPNVIENVLPYLQKTKTDDEACGYVVGYKNNSTHNITLNSTSLPGAEDYRTRIFCKLKDVAHKIFLKRQESEKNYYMGTWHTHPQNIPIPSLIDIKEWEDTLKSDKTGCEYAFFLIFGVDEFRVWYGDYKTKRILELKEIKRINDLYIEG